MTKAQIDNIPEEMKKAAQWVGHRNKIPVNARTGQAGKCNDRSTWCDFYTALDGVKTYELDGIGFEFAEGSGIVGIDIDTCMNPQTGELSMEAAEIISALDSYTEISPSGYGVHIYVKSTPDFSFEGFRNNGNKMPPNGIERYVTKNGKTVKKEPEIEFYNQGRYFTTTGNSLGAPKPIAERTAELNGILEKYAKREQKQTIAAAPQAMVSCSGCTSYLTDDEVVRKATGAKDGLKFGQLYRGNIDGYKSRSEADQALCNILAFWCCEDEAQIDRIFRTSGLMRDKWDEKHGAQTYGQKTIAAAVGSCKAVYDPTQYRQQKVNETPTSYSPENIADTIAEAKTGKPEDIKDNSWIYEDGKGNLRIDCPKLADYIRQKYHYFFACGDARGMKELYLYKNGVYVLQSEDDFKGLIKAHIPRELYKSRDVKEIYEDLKTDLSGGRHNVDICELNSDEDIINFTNGIYHISSGELTPHDPECLSTIQIPCEFKPTEKCYNVGEWDKFIKYHLGGDREQIRLIHEFMGVAISNVNASRMKKALFVVGEGDTGKSQIKNLLTRLIGERNCAPLELSDLEERFGTSMLYQKRLAGCNDMSYMRIDELTNFKKLTGGDVISAEFKGKPLFSFTFKGLFWFCANEMPLFGGDKAQWVYNRMCIIKPTGRAYPSDTPPFDGIVYRDPHLADKLWKEREYIISLAIKALQGVVNRGYEYGITDTNRKYLAAYQTENSSTLTFYEECCVPRPIKGKYDSCTKPILYKVYMEWCKVNSRRGYYDKKQDFHKALETIGMGNVSIVKGTRYYSEFTLSAEAKQEFAYVYGYDNGIISY